MTALNDIDITLIDGSSTTFAAVRQPVTLVVNVASRCGLAPQYEGLVELQHRYGESGFTVIGFPSNQFLQEYGDEGKIAEHCAVNWGVTFPMTSRVRVNGRDRHALYQRLVEARDDHGKAGRVKWNFEKFLVFADDSMRRFRPTVDPLDETVVTAIETALDESAPLQAEA